MLTVMSAQKAETANGEVAAPCDSEIKVTALVGWAIDAPVENNPIRPGCGRPVNGREANNHLRVDVGKPAIT